MTIEVNTTSIKPNAIERWLCDLRSRLSGGGLQGLADSVRDESYRAVWLTCLRKVYYAC